MTIYLGNYNDVLQLLFGFATNVAGIIDGISDGRMTPEQGNAAIGAEVDRMARIFKGKDPDYTQAEYMSTAALAGKVVAWVRTIPGHGDPIRTFFERIAMKVVKICTEVQNGMAEEQAGPELQVFLQSVGERLTGVKP
mgnify:CR=1 FL=1